MVWGRCVSSTFTFEEDAEGEEQVAVSFSDQLEVGCRERVVN